MLHGGCCLFLGVLLQISAKKVAHSRGPAGIQKLRAWCCYPRLCGASFGLYNVFIRPCRVLGFRICGFRDCESRTRTVVDGVNCKALLSFVKLWKGFVEVS